MGNFAKIRVMKRFFVVLALASITFGNPTPHDPPETEKKIKQASESREYALVIAELQKLRGTDEKAFTARNYDYLLARMAESNGDLAVATSSYQAVVNRDSILKPYALRHLSQIARSTGNLMLERIYLKEILLFTPDSLSIESVALRVVRNSIESGNYSEAIRLLTSGSTDRAVAKPAEKTAEREMMALLAESYLRSGQTDQARAAFTDLMNTVPNAEQPDDLALAAAKGLDLIDVGGDALGKKVADLTEAEHIQRAKIYHFNRDFADARLHFEAVIARFPEGSGTPNAVSQIGRGYAQQGDFVEALKWYERVLERHPHSPVAKDTLLQVAAAYGRVGRYKEAMTRYQSFFEKFPVDEKLDRAYLNYVDILRDQGSDTDALKWCEKTREAFRGKLPEAIALFTEVRIYLAREEWQNALDQLERLNALPDLGGAAVPGGTGIDEITFLKGFVLEQLKRYPEAIETYLSIPDGRSYYYGGRSTARLKLLANDETARSHIGQAIGTHSAGLKAKDAEQRRKNALAILRLTDNPTMREPAVTVLKAVFKTLPKYKDVPVFKPNAPASNNELADKLLALGLYDEAAPEFEANSPNLTPDQAFGLADHFRRGDRADRAMAFIEPVWRKIPADYPIELIPRDQLEMLYPAPFANELVRSAAARKVDPRLMLAIMRQESRFQPDAKSYAAARGLMQFISTTSTRIAAVLGRDNFRQDDLYYPPTAILFGSQYLAELFTAFPNQSEAVTASYNAGDDNMKRWFARARSNQPERYVPEIVYSQTKDYVQKVMAN